MIGQLWEGRYLILGLIGAGDTGAVYRVRDRVTERECALKILNLTAKTPEVAALLEREIGGAANIGPLGSDHFVEVLDAGVSDTTPWLVTELLKGEVLARRLARYPPMSRDEVQLILEQLFGAMAAAHAAGVMHRNLKPGNLFLEARETRPAPFILKILDLGLAGIFDSGEARSTFVEPPYYMAPEQISQRPATRATDVWALALIAFELLTGEDYWSATGLGVILEIRSGPYPAPSDRARAIGRGDCIPSGFDAWFHRCLQRKPAARYQDAGEARAAWLELVAGHETPAAPPDDAWSRLSGSLSLDAGQRDAFARVRRFINSALAAHKFWERSFATVVIVKPPATGSASFAALEKELVEAGWRAAAGVDPAEVPRSLLLMTKRFDEPLLDPRATARVETEKLAGSVGAEVDALLQVGEQEAKLFSTNRWR